MGGPVSMDLPGRQESSEQSPATGQAFIRPEERPAVGERTLLQPADQ